MDIYAKLNIPPACHVGNTVYKKLFYENADFSKADMDTFADTVDKVIWQYCVRPSSINIQPYKDTEREYNEIEVIEAALRSDRKIGRVATIIMRTIPYPMLLVLKYKGKVMLLTAHQHTNPNDSSKNTLEDIVSTDWLEESSPLFDKLDIRQMRLTNFYTLYSDMVDTISIFNASQLAPVQEGLTGAQARALTAQVLELERQIAELRAQMKKETQFNRKVELHMEIKKLIQKTNCFKEGYKRE